MAKKNTSIIEITPQSFKDLIHTFRGQQVMIDSDLAAIYGYSTKDFNRQIKNNAEKFEDDFMFQLSYEETAILRSKIMTSNEKDNDHQEAGEQNTEDLRCKKSTSNKRGGRRYNPYAFTEQGVYMLMTVLKGELATKQSKILIRTFKQMKDYIVQNQSLLGQREYPNRNMNMITAGGIFHDRYIVVDYDTPYEKIYHCGASSKDGGNKVTTLNLITDTAVYHTLIDNTLQNPQLQLT